MSNAQTTDICDTNPLLFKAENTDKPSCNDKNGVLAITIEKGEAPFDVMILNKNTKEVIIDRQDISLDSFGFNIFSAGQYSVKVTAANGCEMTNDVNVLSSFLALGIEDDTATCLPGDERKLVYNFASPSRIPGTLGLFEILADGSRSLVNNTEVTAGVVVSNFIKPNTTYLIVAERLSCKLEQFFSISECDESVDAPVLSVNNVAGNQSNVITVYPNPTSGAVKLSLADGIEREIDIFDISGNTVQSLTTKYNDLDISSLSPGCYLIKIKSDKGDVFQKIIKN